MLPELPTQPCLCTQMRLASLQLTEFYDQALQGAGIRINQYSLLVNIARLGTCGTGELAQKVGLEKSTLVRTLKPLIAQGLIDDLAPDSARKRQLRLSPAGEQTLALAIPLWEQAQSRLAENYGEHYAHMMGFLRQLNQA